MRVPAPPTEPGFKPHRSLAETLDTDSLPYSCPAYLSDKGKKMLLQPVFHPVSPWALTGCSASLLGHEQRLMIPKPLSCLVSNENSSTVLRTSMGPLMQAMDDSGKRTYRYESHWTGTRNWGAGRQKWLFTFVGPWGLNAQKLIISQIGPGPPSLWGLADISERRKGEKWISLEEFGTFLILGESSNVWLTSDFQITGILIKITHILSIKNI